MDRSPEKTAADYSDGAMWLAGEASGDALAALVLPGVRERMFGALQYGVGGQKMREAGFEVWRDASVLSVRGYVEVMKKLPVLLMLRKEMIERAKEANPKVFIGVDAPDFNLGIEENLRFSGIRTVHFVSPSVWAWRPERIENVRRAADRVLLVFPFEQEIYDKAGIPATYVGHPMASAIPMVPDTEGARRALEVDGTAGPVIACLPGSRADEIRWNAPVFFGTAREVLKAEPNAQFLIPASDDERRVQIVNALGKFRDVASRVKLFAGRSHEVLEACDAAMIASGTATLEAALYKKPMIVGYKMPAVSSLIMLKKGGATQYVSLPNILSHRRLVPEYLQYYAEPKFMARGLLDQLDPARADFLRPIFTEIHESLKRDTATLAADAIAETAGI